jgi:hypothetical protein
LDDKAHTFQFKPTLYTQLGTHVITVSITDVNGASVSAEFTLRVGAPPRLFAEVRRKHRMQILSTSEHLIPILDKGEANITIISKPRFASHQDYLFNFLPKLKVDIGRFHIKTNIFNEWGSIDVNFDLEVFNEPPQFLSIQEDI